MAKTKYTTLASTSIAAPRVIPRVPENHRRLIGQDQIIQACDLFFNNGKWYHTQCPGQTVEKGIYIRPTTAKQREVNIAMAKQ